MDQIPKLIARLRLIVIGHRKLRAEEKIPDCILVQDSVDQDPLSMALKVDPVIAAAVTVQRATIPLDLAEMLSAQGGKILGKNLKLGQQVELEILG